MCRTPTSRRWTLGLAIGLPGAVALGLLVWGGQSAVTRNREATAARTALTAFLATVSEGRIDEAYREAAPELRCRMSAAQFRGLSGYYAQLKPGLHANVTLRNDWPLAHVADIEVSTHYDQDIPHHAAMLKLDEGWRLAWIDRNEASAVMAADARCGARSMHIALIRRPLRDLVLAFERGDYSVLEARFHPSRSDAARSLAAAYAHLRPKVGALSAALGAEPVFEGDPVQRADATLALTASLRAQGVRFAVRAEAAPDGGWKLTRFDVDAVAARD